MSTMLIIFALLAASPLFVCGGNPVCTAANELRGRYALWSEVVSRIAPGAFDVREAKRWEDVKQAFKRLESARKEMSW